MPDTHALTIEPRTERLKRNRALRAGGSLPGVIYGPQVDSLAVTMPGREFDRVFHKVGKTQLLDLKVNGEGQPRKVLVREVQYDPRKGGAVHVDFYQLNLKEKTIADVPVVVIGEAPAVESREGELQQPLHTIKVSCLPADIPEHFEVDISGLEAVDDVIRVAQVTVPPEVEVLTDPEEIVVKVAHIKVVVEEEVAEEGEEGAEGEEAAEGAEAAAEGGAEAASEGAEGGSEES